MTDPAAWIAVDWGTSNLRAWAMDAENAPSAEASSGAGMNTLARDGFEPALLDLVGPWLRTDGSTTIVACGMVGARQGWIEAPYVPTPCTPLHAEAMTRYQRALEIFEKALGRDHPFVAFPLTGMGKSLIATGDPATALPHLERALALRTAHPGAEADLAVTEFQLARALWEDKGVRARARQLAERSLTRLTAAGAGFAAERAEVERWLGARLDF